MSADVPGAGPGPVSGPDSGAAGAACTSCGRSLGPGERFCGGCGAAAPRPCGSCGRGNPAANRFCASCGLALAAVAPSVPGGTPSWADDDGERRQVTILFCDLVSSTQLSERLDAEELRSTIRRYHAVCRAAVEAEGGHVSHYMGDGVLALFGAPVSREYDAVRAVRAAIRVVEDVRHQTVAATAEGLAARVGIHTGMVVLGEMGAGQARLALDVVGATPNLAARLQSAAEPGQVLISDATNHLVQGFVDTEPAGCLSLKGFSNPVTAYRALADTGARDRADVTPTWRLAPFVGRETDVARLADLCRATRAGASRVAVVVGDAGMGKSRLIQVALDELVADDLAVVQLRGAPDHQTSSLFPVLQLFAPGALPDAVHAAQEDASPERRRRRLIDGLRSWFLEQAGDRPLVLVVEDFHWLDPSTVELLDELVRQPLAARLAVIITTRPDATIPWDAQGHIETVALAPLSPGEVAWLVGSVMRGAHLDDERLGRIIERAEGVPLFAEELAWMMRDVGSAGAGVPHTLEDLLQARLDRLGPNLELARVCSVLGRDVPYTFVRAVTGADDASLRAALDALIDAGTMRVTGTGDEAVYTFRHALLRDAAYEALLRARRHEIHRRAADVLTSDHAAHVAARPETLAVHYAGAAMHAAAMDTWTWAATVAAERFAGPEAIDHLEAALALVPELDDPAEGVTRELRLLLTLGPVVFRIRGLGHPRMHEIYSRAETLCRMVGEGEDRFLALIGLRGYWAAKPDLRRVTELDAELERLAERLSRTWVFLQAHMAIGSLGYMAGDRVKAWDHLERCLTRYDPARPWRDAWDPGIVSMAFLGVMSWERGDLAAALGWFAQAEEVASRRQPFAVAYVGMLLSTFHARLGDPRLAREHAERTLALSTEYGFEQLVADSHCIEGWAIAVGGRPSIGIPLLETGLEEKRASGSFTQSSLHRALLAHALLLADDPDGALAVLDETNAFLETSGERFHEPEVLRLRGEALAALGRRAEAVESATSAHAVATRMGAPLLALRAALTAHRIGACARSVALVRSALDAVAGGDTPECEEARQLLTMGHTTLSVPAE